jgi:hypothetical protein
MGRDRFESWRMRASALGQRRLADAIRRLIYQTDEAMFDQLDYDNDSLFLQPTLFSYFTDPHPSVALPQILYGAILPCRRPTTLQINTDANGQAMLNSFANIETEMPAAALNFCRGSNGSYHCSIGAVSSPFRMHAPLIVPGTHIEVTTRIHPLFYRFFDQPDRPMTNPCQVQAPESSVSYLLIALALIQRYCPAAWLEIAAFIRQIVLYCAPAPNSFAAKSAHGAIFCNVASDHDEVALLEDIAHQAAHVIFNACSHDPMRLIVIDPDTPMNSLCDEPQDTRPINAAFHALFTYTMICRVLTQVLDADVLAERQAHEILGRVGLILYKFSYDLGILSIPKLYTSAGLRCYEAFRTEYQRFTVRYGTLVDTFLYDNQPYAFDYPCFVQRNGGPWPVPCRTES